MGTLDRSAGNGSDTKYPSISFATDALQQQYAKRNAEGKIVGFHTMTEPQLHQLARMWSQGEWDQSMPLPFADAHPMGRGAMYSQIPTYPGPRPAPPDCLPLGIPWWQSRWPWTRFSRPAVCP
jgi:hypothetical protein